MSDPTEPELDIKTHHVIQQGTDQPSGVSEYGLTLEHMVESAVTVDSPKSQGAPDSGWCRLLSLNFYRQYFRVTESEVIQRIKLSLRPFRADFFEISR